MTEDEAKTKACHAARYFDPGNGDTPKCCGSACMAWRVGATSTEIQSWTRPADNAVKIADETHDTLPVWRGPKTGGNFCGLAGAPQ